MRSYLGHVVRIIAVRPYQFFTRIGHHGPEIHRIDCIPMSTPTVQTPSSRVVTLSPSLPSEQEAQLRQAAQDLEASFLSEMLKQARFGETRGAFGGGAGEEQFSSFLRMEHARQMAAAGGIGLAENLFRSLVARAHGNGGGQ